jgi:hypothetical protein
MKEQMEIPEEREKKTKKMEAEA